MATLLTDESGEIVATPCLTCDADIPMTAERAAELDAENPNGWSMVCFACCPPDDAEANERDA